MPVRRISGEEEMHKHWLTNDTHIDLNAIESKTISHLNNSEDNGYKSSLNDSVVDDLVSTLTNKLCLKSKSCHTICKHNRMSRMSPYQTHNSSITKTQSNNSCFCLNCKFIINGNNSNNNAKHKSSSISDTYELMQELLREGSLIKEAVKRLQYGKEVTKKIDFYDYSDDEFGQNENEINLLNS